ncbi:glycogen synthase GlgA [Sphingobium sp. SCG-1]|uniref:glycogen synthase GlgA n=1 Tax=Sphingobium sp. SCG-1 TaxID=2072936 RepID=UPI000CD6AA4C|nr:glycogen synthase GlgA [Sphingobium sp. SCG-1]AUW58414.1 glycogen synthase GlgA [Sphingobium sp. SCG-1]
MRVLSVASEIQPLVKTGGLADVVGALPLALAGEGVATRTLVPGYPEVLAKIGATEKLHHYDDLLGQPATLVSAHAHGLDLIVLDSPAFFAREGGPYDDRAGNGWPDNWRRFAALSRAGADIAAGLIDGWSPDLVHAHDWQAAMTLAYMRFGAAHAVPKVMTIHNLAFQGWFDAGIFNALGLPAGAFSVDGVEYYGGVGFLKAGLISADAITTVSPSYAMEIQSQAEGMGLEGLLSGRADRLHGILNGIDTQEWNPADDRLLAATYSSDNIAGRVANRKRIEESFGLDPDDSPLFIVISRLTWQKGMDLLADVIDHLVARGAKLAVLGSGDRALEARFLAAGERNKGRVAVRIGYDEPLSHLMQGGGDAILIPSRFEPCGLTQLYGLRYGCVPVVARVGGLADTLIDANEAALAAGVATGIQFAPPNAESLLSAIDRAVVLHADPSLWKSMQRAGMAADFSWSKSAARYAALYRSLAK